MNGTILRARVHTIPMDGDDMRYLYASWEFQEAPVKDCYIQSGPNKGAHVRIIGRNLEGEPVVQRLDGQPLEWPQGHRRHVLDLPGNMLGETKPEPTLLEAAEAVVNTARKWQSITWEPGESEGWAFDVIDDLSEAIEREEAPF